MFDVRGLMFDVMKSGIQENADISKESMNAGINLAKTAVPAAVPDVSSLSLFDVERWTLSVGRLLRQKKPQLI
jgi:hypothetical protein